MFPQITGFYDISAFSNIMFLMKALPQMALGTLNLLSLRPSLRRDCEDSTLLRLFISSVGSAAFHLHQIYGSTTDK